MIMKYKKGQLKKIIRYITLIIFIIFAIQLFKYIDYNRVLEKKQPLFCFEKHVALDGGSVEWKGLGYKIIDFDESSGYQSVKIGDYMMSTNDFEEERNEFRNTHEYRRMIIFPSCYGDELNNELAFDIKGYSDNFINISEIIDKIVFDNEPIEVGNSKYTIIIMEYKENSKEYILCEKENEKYLIDINKGKYKLKSEEANEITNIISETMKKNNQYYGNAYKVRMSIVLIAAIAMAIIIIDRKKKHKKNF